VGLEKNLGFFLIEEGLKTKRYGTWKNFVAFLIEEREYLF
jgi:hypothetical protein